MKYWTKEEIKQKKLLLIESLATDFRPTAVLIKGCRMERSTANGVLRKLKEAKILNHKYLKIGKGQKQSYWAWSKPSSKSEAIDLLFKLNKNWRSPENENK